MQNVELQYNELDHSNTHVRGVIFRIPSHDGQLHHEQRGWGG